MIWKSHAPFGLACYLAAVTATGIPLSPLGLPIAIGGALLPDIDHPGSKIGSRMPAVATVLRALGGHRGLTHSLLFNLSLLALLTVLSARFEDIAGRWAASAFWIHFALPLLAGVASHALADVLTPSGVRLLWPLQVRIRFPLVGSIRRTSHGTQAGLRETLIAWGSPVITAYWWVASGGPSASLPTTLAGIF